MSPQAQSILEQNSLYFESSNIFGDILRWLGWKLCIGLKVFCDLVQKVFDAAYELVSFANDNIFKNFLGDFYPVAVAILTVSFIILGLTYMFSDKRPDIIKNALIGMAVIFIAPQITDLMNDLIITGKNAMTSDVSVSSQAISSNVKDLQYIAFNNFDFDLNVSESTKNNLMYIEMNEHVKPEGISTQLQKDVFSYIPNITSEGNLEFAEIGKKGMFDIFDPPYYYRYSYHFFQIVIVLLANIIILLFSAYAVIRMLWEILTTRVMGSLLSLELASGQKLKKCIESFISAYVVLFMISVNIKIFQLIQQFVNNEFPQPGQGLIRSILIIFIALVVIDGPRFIEQLLGFDLGVSNGSQKLFGLMRMVQQAQMQRNFANNAKRYKSNDANSKDATSKMEGKSNTNATNKNNEPNISGKTNGTNNTTEPNINTGNVGFSGINEGGSNVSTRNTSSSASSNGTEPNVSSSNTTNEPNMNTGNVGFSGINEGESNVSTRNTSPSASSNGTEPNVSSSNTTNEPNINTGNVGSSGINEEESNVSSRNMSPSAFSNGTEPNVNTMNVLSGSNNVNKMSNVSGANKGDAKNSKNVAASSNKSGNGTSGAESGSSKINAAKNLNLQPGENLGVNNAIDKKAADSKPDKDLSSSAGSYKDNNSSVPDSLNHLQAVGSTGVNNTIDKKAANSKPDKDLSSSAGSYKDDNSSVPDSLNQLQPGGSTGVNNAINKIATDSTADKGLSSTSGNHKNNSSAAFESSNHNKMNTDSKNMTVKTEERNTPSESGKRVNSTKTNTSKRPHLSNRQWSTKSTKSRDKED